MPVIPTKNNNVLLWYIKIISLQSRIYKVSEAGVRTNSPLWGLVCYNLRKKIKPRFLIRQILWTPLCTGCCVKTKRKWAELTGWRLRNRWALDAGYVFCWDLYHDMRRLHAHIRSISRNGFILCKFFAVIFVNNSLELTPSAVFFFTVRWQCIEVSSN